jgi:serine O-acetyltransferase
MFCGFKICRLTASFETKSNSGEKSMGGWLRKHAAVDAEEIREGRSPGGRHNPLAGLCEEKGTMVVTFIRMMKEDIQSVFDRDPAARSTLEIMLTYPGLHSIWAYRFTNWMWKHNIKLLARWLSHVARFLTGIEIHPGATIGRRFFIDHGMGIVIGETAEIGDDVTLYHGVTLGGTSLQKGKRHPTLEHDVVVGAGAKVLGAIVVGAGSRIGANAVVNKPVPPNSVVVGVPGQVVVRSKPRPVSDGPDLAHNVLPDTIGVTIASLMDRLEKVETAMADNGHEHPVTRKLEKLDVLELKLHGHLEKDHRAANWNGRPAQAAVIDHVPHAPEHGVWRGEDFSI